MSYLFVLGGFAALIVGGDLVVRGAVAVARRLAIPPMVIGLTLVGFGTSAPELAPSLQAALDGAPGIAVGNVVGSNIANILLILGIAALLRPVAVDREAFRRDGVVLLASTALCFLLAATGTIARWHGAILLAGLALFLWRAFRGTGTGAALDPDPAPGAHLSPLGAFALFAAGLALLLAGARGLVSGAVEIAAALGVSEAVIGVTVVAVGTSLPELVTSVIAARRGESDVAFGNVVGSNIFNILGILGATALIAPLPVPPETMALDAWAMAAATLLLVAAAVTGKGVSRGEGAALLAFYAAYLGLLFA